MKRLLAVLVAVVAGVMFLSASVYADGAKTAKGTVTVAKGGDGKITSVSIATDSGMHITVAATDYPKYSTLNGKFVQVSFTTDKDGKNIATGSPTPATPDSKNKIAPDKSKKM